jgi:hypothetical protein
MTGSPGCILPLARCEFRLMETRRALFGWTRALGNVRHSDRVAPMIRASKGRSSGVFGHVGPGTPLPKHDPYVQAHAITAIVQRDMRTVPIRYSLDNRQTQAASGL